MATAKCNSTKTNLKKDAVPTLKPRPKLGQTFEVKEI